MTEPDALASELVHVPTLRRAREIKKLAKREVTRVRRGKIEETRFLLAITEVAEGFEMFRADHSERMSSIISGSDMAGRSRAHLSRGVGTAMRPFRCCPIPSKGTSGRKKYEEKNPASP